MKKIIGYAMLGAPFVVLFLAAGWAIGWGTMLLLAGLFVGLIVWTFTAERLINSSDYRGMK